MAKEELNTDNSNKTGCGGCFSSIFLVGIIMLLTLWCMDDSDFYLMPGEANLITDALQETFDQIDQILPDTLMIIEEPNRYNHYSEGESFGNIYYGLNPVIDVVSVADTSRKYKFQYIARVDHIDANEFEIKLFLIDSIWRDEPLQYEFGNPFNGN